MSKISLKKEAFVDDLSAASTVSDEELELINGYTRRKFSADEVYVFSLVLCDNDVDRDRERFTVESLFALEKLFVGKTGVFDHEPSAKNQTARIISCEVEAVSGKKTATGDDYFRLKARAYMPRSEKNADLILALESGIIKEVSVGCAVEKTVCSICGEKIGECAHIKGETYGNKLCCGELINPFDAYEFSFVAVPAQKTAGVTKSFYSDRKDFDMESIIKKLKSNDEVVLGIDECREILKYIDGLKQAASDGVYFRETLTSEVLRLSAAVESDISRETMESLTKSMTVAQLNEFKTAFEKRKSERFAVSPQLYGGRENTNNDRLNTEFKI